MNHQKHKSINIPRATNKELVEILGCKKCQQEASFSPLNNKNVISIIKQEDGNYKGWINKFGKLIEVRGISPDEVLRLLLTHNGQ